MKKNFMQDVTPSNSKRSIRDIPLPNHKEGQTKRDIKPKMIEEEYEEPHYASVKSSREEPEPVQEIYSTYSKEEEEEEYEAPKKRRKSSSSFSKKLIVALSVACGVFLLVVIGKTDAKITITQKKTTAEINTSIPTDGSNKIITKTQLSKTVSKTLPATGEKQVEKQANGKIKIINTHKETPQELVKNTRFQAPNGLIYRIQDSIVVPGYTMNGQNIVPGTLEVEVFADSAGEDYNTSGTVKFTIPGFSGKEQFEKITAESVTAMAGGYIGIQKVISDKEKEQVEKELRQELEKQFNKEESAEYIIVPKIDTLSFGEIQDKAEGNNVTISLSARVDAYSFVKKDLSNFIGQQTIPNALTQETFDVDTKNLSFSIQENGIQISGTGLITHLTDIEKLKKDFAGKKRDQKDAILDTYTSIKEAKASLSPFWKGTYPKELEKIEVIIE